MGNSRLDLEVQDKDSVAEVATEPASSQYPFSFFTVILFYFKCVVSKNKSYISQTPSQVGPDHVTVFWPIRCGKKDVLYFQVELKAA